MTKNTERIPQSILHDVAQNMGYEGDNFMDDPKMVQHINNITPDAIFKKWCEWQGLINWSGTIKGVMMEIYGLHDVDMEV
jgi:hypothetical protein